MTDPGLNSILKWSIENSENGTVNTTPQDPARGLNADALAQLMGGPSDADRMRESMSIIAAEDVDLDAKLVAFDNFEQLVEQIDNANNMESLGLWMPLVELLQSKEPQLREYAAWCIGTAVQNNPRAQERCLVLDAVPQLVNLALHDDAVPTRKKAILALSSEMRNYQPGLDAALKRLPQEYHPPGKADATDMESIDFIVSSLRTKVLT